MAFNKYIIINNEELPFPDSYDLDYKVLSNSNETESGKVVREIIRNHKAEIKVSFTLSSKWIKKMTEYMGEDKLSVSYLDTNTIGMKNADMYIENYRVSLLRDTSYGSLWSVDFKLIEY